MILAIFAFASIQAFAETATNGNVKIEFETLADGGIHILKVWNYSDKRITLMIDGGGSIQIDAKQSQDMKRYAKRNVRYDYPTSSGGSLWRRSEEPKKNTPAVSPLPVESKADNNPKQNESSASPTVEKPEKQEKQEKPGKTPAETTNIESYKPSNQPTYIDKLNQDVFFGHDAVNAYVQKTNSLCQGIASAEDKRQYVIDHDVNDFLLKSKKEIEVKQAEIPNLAKQFISEANIPVQNQSSAIDLIIETLNTRLKTREDGYSKLNEAVQQAESGNNHPQDNTGDIINYCIVGSILLVIVILIVMAMKRRRKNKASGAGQHAAVTQRAANSDTPDNPNIVVRRRTTSILKKQCLDDVVDNPAYLAIKASEISSNSAIGTIYIKNSCIKDVYNLYAEDLRNTDNPKEDGCMVLGRWVLDKATNKYDVSLEEVVYPGDDAVFKEYELNFGGKIKLRIAERLRKLRKETNLQYDLVSWIHSHPGLGVFFSNSDDNVQMQLKHSQHPNFLVAFVVDILTSEQETGIFTFKEDGSMNSKNDLKKMYSLEKLYNWALQSERNSFSADNYYNVLGNAKLKMPACNGVQLNNSSIIDLTQIIVEPETGIVGWATGTSIEMKGATENIVNGIVRNSEKPAAGITGILISMTNLSHPTIQRIVSPALRNISFVMVYSSKQMTLTTIPVINGELLTDEQFYGDVTIEELKIWTRRKR